MIAPLDSHTTALDALEQLPVAQRLALAAKLRGLPVRDNSYQETPLGKLVARYLDYKRWRNVAPATIANREGPLALLSLDFANLTIEQFEGRPGAKLLFDFLTDHWGDQADSTRANRTSILRDFFAYCHREGHLERNPMLYIESPRRRGRRRDAHDAAEMTQLIRAQPRWRDRIALKLLVYQGLRKSELTGVQLGHFDFSQRTVAIFGKGSKYAEASLYGDLAEDAERYCQERAFLEPRRWRTEYLLFVERAVRRGEYPVYVYETAEYRNRPLSSTAAHVWFKTCLNQAGLPDFPMHELRHTAGTLFHRRHGDLEMTRQFLRHEQITSTAGYIHSPSRDLARRVAETYDPLSEA